MRRLLALGFCIVLSASCKKKEQSPPAEVDPAAPHIAKLKDGSAAERVEAINALLRLGDQARSAIPQLERALEDANEKVREEAARTMQVIAPENAGGRSGFMLVLLNQIGRAMHEQAAANNGSLLPTCTVVNARDGKQPPRPGLSWRVLLLPYLDQKDLFAQFKLDEPWNSEHNRKLIEKMPAVYAPPTGSLGTAKPGETHMQVFTCAAPLGFATGTSPFAHPAMITFQNHPPCRMHDIVDGTSHTFLIVEAAKPVIWTKPEDVTVSDSPLPELGHSVDGLFHVCMADGAPMRFSRRASAYNIRASIGRADGLTCELDAMSPALAPPAPTETAPVLGRVMVKGAPLTAGWVVLHDTFGREYGGPLGLDGSFLVKAVPVGKVQVAIAMGDPFAAWLANPEVKFKFPMRLPVQDKYMHRDQSGLVIDVKANAKEFVLELE